MKKTFYKIINPFRTAYWFIFRPKTMGVGCLIENDGKFLLIRNSYGYKHWTLPGGGVDRNESPEEAAQRETKEEVGIDVTNLVSLGEYVNTKQYKRDTVYCFYAKVYDDYFKIDNAEVSEAAWFSEADMPTFRSSAVDRVLNLHRLKLGV